MDLNLAEFLKIPSQPEKGESKVYDARGPLTSKKAIELLMEGKLGSKVCKFCLNLEPNMYEMGQIFEIAGKKGSCRVTVRDMVGSIYPFEILNEKELPQSICNKCLNRTISSYLFAQQIDRSERALQNFIEDMNNKFDKLDPLDRPKKRGRQKINPNSDTLYAACEFVYDYADPQMCLVNRGNDLKKDTINQLECPKCWRQFSSIELRMSHEIIHPASMWYCCRICGYSFPKYQGYRRHIRETHDAPVVIKNPTLACQCKCGNITGNYSEHLQHIEKHKFRTIMESMISGKMDKLCVICMGKEHGMVGLDMKLRLHGGYPEITGDRTLQSILNTTIPDITRPSQLTGTKICESCLDRVISTYLLIQQSHCIKSRLSNCMDHMINSLETVEGPNHKIFVEISSNLIMPKIESDIFDVDTDELKVEVLEDEFRIEESGSESENEANVKSDSLDSEYEVKVLKDNCQKQYAAKRNVHNKIAPLIPNGIDIKKDVCSEFLTFHGKKRKRFNVEGNVACLVCDKRFISNYFLMLHMKKHKYCDVGCPKCSHRFKSKFHAKEHIKKDHGVNAYILACGECGRSFKSESKLLEHETMHLRNKCRYCNKRFISYNRYIEHLQRHLIVIKRAEALRTKNHVCSICEMECGSNNELYIHINKHHLLLKPFCCDMCEKQFYGAKSLACHKRLHNLPSNETCTFCNKVMKNRRHFVVHLRKHLNTKPFNCPVCDVSFFCKSKKICHMVKSHGGKFVCKLCNSVFFKKTDLKYHRKINHKLFC